MMMNVRFICKIFVAWMASVCFVLSMSAQTQWKRNLVVARDGTGDYRTLTEAVEAIRAFMDYKVTVHVKPGTYKEKLVVPSWLQNVEFVGENAENTFITYDDHARINNMGTFRTYTLKVEGNDITFRNLTIENNAEPLGQAVALHTEGDRLRFINCRLLGNQDTVFTGAAGTCLYFKDCYIEGTTDFIFGPSTALFENCVLYSKRDSYITAASTPSFTKNSVNNLCFSYTSLAYVSPCFVKWIWLSTICIYPFCVKSRIAFVTAGFDTPSSRAISTECTSLSPTERRRIASK